MARTIATRRLFHFACARLRKIHFRKFSSDQHDKRYLTCSREVGQALVNGRPVVALESTIITHGMPYPDNLKTAHEVENIVRECGATPATVAIIKGKIRVGLDSSELEWISKPRTDVIKTSRRDLPFVLSQDKNGGMTVSGTMIAAQRMGIPVFVTGGIGGVHRGAESSMDISADLTELGRTPVAVVSAGVKSILDIGRTLEYLETEGVCVATYGKTKDFPAFFTPTSGFQAPYNVETPLEAAKLIDSSLRFGLGSGMLIAVPIQPEHAASGHLVESAIQEAVQAANKRGIKGKYVTPFILEKVNDITEGKSLEANIALIKHNAEIGSKIAVELASLRTSGAGSHVVRKTLAGDVANSKHKHGRPIVIGGVNVDFTATFKEDKIKPNGATYKGQIRPSFGGVGRNLADCLTRLGANPLFLSVVGTDSYADLFFQQCSHMDLSNISQIEDVSTATYCAVLKSSGQLIYGMGDFGVHSLIDKAYLSQFEHELSTAPMVVFDGNSTAETMQYICDLCSNAGVPVFFEPADMTHISKLFKSSAWKQLTYCSPNMNELRMMRELLDGKTELIDKDSGSNGNESDTLEEALKLSKALLPCVPNLLVTLGEYGAMMVRRYHESEGYTAVHYPVLPTSNIVSVSGAGDCLAAAVVCGIVQGLTEDHYMKSGLVAARKSLLGSTPVPDTIVPGIMSSAHVELETDQSYSPKIFQSKG